ncbi:hypothetical protein G9A89_017906 [Geosiphon pyriformis]|nr:hypothetical protein G9A89_017906 [Geosiphon pyriformis]
MVKNDSTTNHSTTTTTTTTTRIHPGAVYTSRLLTAQMVDISKDESVKEIVEGDDSTTKSSENVLVETKKPLGIFSKYIKFLKKTNKRDEIAKPSTTATSEID